MSIQHEPFIKWDQSMLVRLILEVRKALLSSSFNTGLKPSPKGLPSNKLWPGRQTEEVSDTRQPFLFLLTVHPCHILHPLLPVLEHCYFSALLCTLSLVFGDVRPHTCCLCSTTKSHIPDTNTPHPLTSHHWSSQHHLSQEAFLGLFGP